MQTWFSAGIDICLAILFGYYLIENQVSVNTKRAIGHIKKLTSILLIIFLIGLLVVATLNITQANLNNLFPAIISVAKLTILGNMAILALLASILILLLNLISNKTNKYLYLFAIIVLAYAKADIGHAADYGYIHWLVINHALHILAACAWAGSVIAAIFLLPYWRSFTPNDSFTLAQRLSSIATIAVPITIVCGIVDSLRILYGQENIWFSAYFITLAIKISLVFIAIILGLINRWYWMSKIIKDNDNSGFIQTISVETVGLILVLIAAAKLGMTMIPA